LNLFFFCSQSLGIPFCIEGKKKKKKKNPTNKKTEDRNKPQLRLILGLLRATKETSTTSGNKTSLLTLRSVTRDGRGLSDMLMVTSSVRMVDGIHCNTTSLGPAVPLNLVLVHSTRSLKERFVGSSTTSDNTNHATGSRGNDLLCTRGEPDTGLSFIG